MPFVLAPLFVDPVTAAAAIALIIAGVLLADMLSSLLGKISIGPISINPGAWFSSIAHSIERWAIGKFDGIIAPVGAWLNAIAYDGYHNLSSVVAAISHLGDQIAHIVTSTVPDAIAHQFANIMGIVDQDVGKLSVKVDQAVTKVEGDITTAIDHQFAHIMGIVDSDIGQLHGYVDNAVAGAERIASSALATVEHTLEGDVTRAIQTAEAAAAAADAALSRDLDAAIGAAEAAAGAAAGVLQGEITSANAQLATIAASAAAALALARTIAGEFESCAVTSCEGPNNLSNLLNQLLGIVSFADLAAFIALAINHPGVAAGEFAGVASGLYADADQLLSTLLAI